MSGAHVHGGYPSRSTSKFRTPHRQLSHFEDETESSSGYESSDYDTSYEGYEVSPDDSVSVYPHDTKYHDELVDDGYYSRGPYGRNYDRYEEATVSPATVRLATVRPESRVRPSAAARNDYSTRDGEVSLHDHIRGFGQHSAPSNIPISSTISKDNTAGNCTRQAELWAYLGQKIGNGMKQASDPPAASDREKEKHRDRSSSRPVLTTMPPPRRKPIVIGADPFSRSSAQAGSPPHKSVNFGAGDGDYDNESFAVGDYISPAEARRDFGIQIPRVSPRRESGDFSSPPRAGVLRPRLPLQSAYTTRTVPIGPDMETYYGSPSGRGRSRLDQGYYPEGDDVEISGGQRSRRGSSNTYHTAGYTVDNGGSSRMYTVRENLAYYPSSGHSPKGYAVPVPIHNGPPSVARVVPYGKMSTAKSYTYDDVAYGSVPHTLEDYPGYVHA